MFKLADRNDVPEGKSLTVSLPTGRKIALFNIDGVIYALNNECPHQGGPLGNGDIEGDCITCPWHGWQFNIKSGACVNMPGEEATSLQIEIKEEEIYLIETECTKSS